MRLTDYQIGRMADAAVSEYRHTGCWSSAYLAALAYARCDMGVCPGEDDVEDALLWARETVLEA